MSACSGRGLLRWVKVWHMSPNSPLPNLVGEHAPIFNASVLPRSSTSPIARLTIGASILGLAAPRARIRIHSFQSTTQSSSRWHWASSRQKPPLERGTVTPRTSVISQPLPQFPGASDAATHLADCISERCALCTSRCTADERQDKWINHRFSPHDCQTLKSQVCSLLWWKWKIT